METTYVILRQMPKLTSGGDTPYKFTKYMNKNIGYTIIPKIYI
jgi:hypothetical protein